MRNRLVNFLVFASAFLVMGVSMPSCPGQKAMQQQVDGLLKKEAHMNRRISNLQSQVSALNKEMVQVKTLLSQVSTVVLDQKNKIETLQSDVASLKSKKGSKTQSSKKSSKKKRKK